MTSTPISQCSTSSSMHGYGESWFENQHELAMEYLRQKQSQKQAQPQPMHCYGDSWFEELNHQREEFEQQHQQKSQSSSQPQQPQQQQQQSQQPQLHNYGTGWFEHYEPMWEDWKHVRMMTTEVKNYRFDHLALDSDDESCEIGQ